MSTASCYCLPSQTLIQRLSVLSKCFTTKAAIAIALRPKIQARISIGTLTRSKEFEEIVATTACAALSFLHAIVCHNERVRASRLGCTIQSEIFVSCASACLDSLHSRDRRLRSRAQRQGCEPLSVAGRNMAAKGVVMWLPCWSRRRCLPSPGSPSSRWLDPGCVARSRRRADAPKGTYPLGTCYEGYSGRPVEVQADDC